MNTLDKANALLEAEEIGDIKLSSWESEFLSDVLERYTDEGDMTENQCSKIDQIYSEKM